MIKINSDLTDVSTLDVSVDVDQAKVVLLTNAFSVFGYRSGYLLITALLIRRLSH